MIKQFGDYHYTKPYVRTIGLRLILPTEFFARFLFADRVGGGNGGEEGVFLFLAEFTAGEKRRIVGEQLIDVSRARRAESVPGVSYVGVLFDIRLRIVTVVIG